MDSNGCQIALGIIVPLIESCSPPNPPTSLEPTLFVCQNEANTDSFNLQFAANAQIAWFETNDINDTIPIALGESYVFEALGTYWASAYTFSETDTCYSERIPLEVKEVILLPSFNVPINITEGQSIQLSVSVESNIENSTFSVEWTGIGLDDYTILNPIATPDTTTVYTATFTDQHECTATTTVTVFVEQITTCTAPSSPISFGSIFLCSQAPEPFQIGTNNEIAWFSSNNLNDTIPIAFGEEYIFEEAGTYWAAAFTTFEEDTCYSSSRTPFVLARAFEVENTGGETIQEGESVQISASVINPENGVTYSVQWEGEGLDFYDIENPTASPNVTTEYTATFTDSDGCIAKTFITVFVEGIATCTTPAPPTPIEQTLVVCENELNTQSFSMNVEVGAQIAWFASNNSADISPISFGANAIFQSPDTYYAAAYKVLGTDTCFSNRVLFSIEEMILTATNSGNVTISQGESIEISVSPLESSVLPLLNVTLQWDNEASLDNAMSHNPIASPIETTTYTATFTEIHGCEVTTSLTVTVEPSNDCPNPPPSPLQQNLLTCQGVPNTDPFTVEPVEEGVQVAWFATNDPLDLNFLMVGESVVFPNSGIYYAATFTISANSDICISDRMPFILEEIILTTNSSEDVEIQQGDEIQLSVSASSTIEGSTFTVQWSGEEGLSNYNIENPIASPTETTTYTATFTDEFGCTVSTSILVTVIPNSPCITLDPPLAFEQRLLVCEGESNTEPFSLQAQGGEQIVWFTTDDPLDLIFIATGTDAVFENTGNYYAAAFMIENGKACFSPRILFTIEEITLTTSNSGNTTITAGQSTEIPVFAESNIENNTFSIQWEGEGLDDYTSFNPTASPTETTIYTAIVTDDYGCTDTASLTITVITESDDCQAKITTSNGQFTNCNGGDYSLTVLDESEGENITRYQIDWGDGSINYDESDFPTNGVNHTYSIGIFTLTYTITTANACNSTIEKTIHNDIADPIIGLINTGNTSACGPVELCFEISLFENNHPSTVYEVSFGDSSEPELYNHPPPNPICHPYAASHCETAENGFDFSITARNACSENEAIIPSIVIGTPPTAQFTTNSNTVSIGQSIQLTNTSIEGYDTNCSQETDYLWDFGNNQTSNQESPIQTYNTAGIYQVCLTATNDCSTDEHCQTITVQDPGTTTPTTTDSNLQTRNIAHPNVTGPYGVQVNTYNGNLYFQRTDLVIPNTSLSIDLSFSYNSFRDSLDIGFGKGWTFSYNTYYYEDSTGIVLVRADGRRDFFRKEGNNYTSVEGTFDTWQEYQSNQFMLETKYGMRYYFDDTGHKKLTKIEDTNGNVLQLTYNTNGFPSRITDQSNRFVDLNWTNGHLSSVEDSNEEMRTVNYDYNSDGQLLKVTNPEGGEIQYEYQEGEDALTAIINERNDALDIYYDQNGAVEELVSCLSVLKMRYNRIDYRTYAIEKNPSGNRMITLVFDEDGKFISKKGNCCGYNTQYDYDDGLNVNKMTDANGNVFTVNHDNQGNALLITDPNGDQQSLSFQSNFNRVKSLTDKKGFMTSFNYDVDGNLKDIFQPESIKIQFEYDSKGNIENMKDGNGNYTLMTYNENNDLVEITYPIAGTGESFEYDNRGNMEQSTDGNGNYVKYEYDELSRLIGVQDKLQNEVKLEYDLSSNLTSEIDANSNIKNYAYDALHRLESVETPSGTTNYDYDPSDNLTMITDANQNSTLFQYNTRNLLIEETDALGNTLYYSYDGNGNMMAKTDANGELTTYTYDKLNRLTSKTYKGNTDTYTYDANGNLTHCSNNGISMSFTYDSINRLVAKTVDNWNQTIEYEYDENSNRTKMIDETGETIYTYDVNNRLISIKNPKQELTEFEYDLGGRMTKQIQANGVVTTYTYDDADRLLKLENKKANGTIVSSYEYVYDGNGNRTQMTEADGTVWEYEYDGDNRLTRTSNGTVDENYTFDAVGNRLTLNNQEYNYDEADRIKNADNTNYQFDSNGNLVEKDENGAITTYEYDGENRLISILTSNGETVKFQYDPFGNRISRTVNGEVTRYLLDGDNVLIELNANNDMTARYTAGLGLDSWLSMERNNSSYFYHTDGLGSITVLTNGSENVENTYQYDSYGNINQQTGSITNPYTYTGREREETIGLYYYRTRFYDSEVGRFITRDKFRGVLYKPMSLNKYSYVENSPINYIDPIGMMKQLCNEGGITQALSFDFKIAGWIRRLIGRITGNEFLGQGGSLGIAVSHPGIFSDGGKWDLGLFYQVTGGGGDIGIPEIGIGSAAISYQNNIGSLKDFAGKSTSGYIHGGRFGGGVSFNENNSFSGLKFSVGQGYYVGGGVNFTGVASFREGFRGHDESNNDCNPSNGSQEEKNPSSPPSSNEGNPPPSGSNGNSTNIPIIGSVDPNEIIAPKGYGTQKWVAQDATLPYTILFENDPDFATAAAQRVRIDHTFDEDLNASTFRLGDFGFGSHYFTVPEDLTYYNTQINLVDSLGVMLQVTAGVDADNNRAFWELQSRDPETGLTTTLPANIGFLPVNDTISRVGEGFVNFTIRPSKNTITGDTILAKASIIFDDNAPIATNVDFNTIDADAPLTTIEEVEANNGVYELQWSGTDSIAGLMGSGISTYSLYTSTNEGAFLPIANNLTQTSYTYTGSPTDNHCFFVIGRDNVNNQEAIKLNCEPACMNVSIANIVPASGGGANGSIELEVTDNGANLTYQWSHDENLNSPIALDLAAGEYSVVVIDGAGCEIKATFVIDELTDIEDAILVENSLFIHRMYPVPTDTELMIEFSTTSPTVLLEVYDMMGKKLFTQAIKTNSNNQSFQQFTLNTESYPSANYLVRIQSKTSSVSGMFVRR